MLLSPRFFNTTGPCRPQDHYMLPPGRRLPELARLVAERRYFVLHAARQTGKTTAMRAFAEDLRSQGVVALHTSVEASRAFSEVEPAEKIWIGALARQARLDLPAEQRPPPPEESWRQETGGRLTWWLEEWCLRLQPRALVLLLDEVDSLEGQPMVNLLAQLRAGFNNRPQGFPSSVVLIGMRDLKDYLVLAKGGLPPNPGSPFNIKAESLTLRNFTHAEVAELYAQHTSDTGQAFTEDAVDRAFYWSQGQPFLVNALAYHLTRREPVPAPTPITGADIDRAKDHLVLSRTTHLDNLVHRLHEPRVARVVRPILLGETPPTDPSDDLQYAVDLGLIAPGPEGYAPANPLYQEVLPRSLALIHQQAMPDPWWRWRTADGRLDVPALVDAFFAWWREHGDTLIDGTSAGWKEAAAHLVFMGFVQRVVNGGGKVTREYASGSGALDVLVEYGGRRHAFELKRVRPVHDSLEYVQDQGASQLCAYLDRLGLQEGWLLIFDQRPGLSWTERLWRDDRTVGGRLLHLRGG